MLFFRNVAAITMASCLASVLLCAGVSWSQEQAPAKKLELPEASASPGWLGVSLKNIESTDGKPPRVRIDMVFDGSPAIDAGIQADDFVIAIDGVTLTAGVREMIARVKAHSLGETARFRIERAGNTFEKVVTLAKVPDRKALAKAMTEDRWVGKELPPLSVRDVDTGELIDFLSYRGRVVVIDFWATWCGPCRKSMPTLEKVQADYRDQGVSIIAVSDEEQEVVGRFARNRPIEFDRVGYDDERSLPKALALTSYPTYVVIDQKGVIRRFLRGTGGSKEVAAVVAELLAEP